MATALERLADGGEDMALLLVEEGAIRGLVMLAATQDAQTQLQVANTLASLAAHELNRAHIAAQGALTPLLAMMLHSSDSDVKIACAKALGALAENEAARAMVQQGVPSLTPAAQDSAAPSATGS